MALSPEPNTARASSSTLNSTRLPSTMRDRPKDVEYRDKIEQIRADNVLSTTEDFVFVEVTVTDPPSSRPV